MQSLSVGNNAVDLQRSEPLGSRSTGSASSHGAQVVSETKTDLVHNAAIPPVDQSPEVDRERLEEAVERANGLVSSPQRGLKFSVDENTDVPVISVFDKDTDTLVRQIPSDVVLNLIERLDEVSGLLFQDEA